jgi:hypothetical protein
VLYVYRNRECSANPWALTTKLLTEDAATRPFFPPQLWERVAVAFEGFLVTTKTFPAADVNATTNAITEAAHGLADGQAVQLRNLLGTLPGGTAKGTQYFVQDKDADTFKVSTFPTALAGVVATASNNRITKVAHGLAVDQPVVFRSVGASGITAGTTYYVRVVVDADNFTLSATLGGSEFDLTGDATGMICFPIVDLTSQGSGTHTLLVQLHYGAPVPGLEANPPDPVLVMDAAFALSAVALVSTPTDPWWEVAPATMTANGFASYARPFRREFDYFELLPPASPVWAYRRRHGQGEWAFSLVKLNEDERTRGVFDPDIWERITVELTEPSLVQPAETTTEPLVQINWQWYFLIEQYLRNRRRGWLILPPQFLVPAGIVTFRPKGITPALPAAAVAESWPTSIRPDAAEAAADSAGPLGIVPAAAAAGADTGGPNP